MDSRVLELRIRQWIPVLEEQEKSALSKEEWCIANGINRGSENVIWIYHKAG